MINGETAPSLANHDDDTWYGRLIMGEFPPKTKDNSPLPDNPTEITVTHKVAGSEVPLDNERVQAALNEAGFRVVVLRGYYQEMLYQKIYQIGRLETITLPIDPVLSQHLEDKQLLVGSTQLIDRSLFQASSQGGNQSVRIILFGDGTLCCLHPAGVEAGQKLLDQITKRSAGKVINFDQIKALITGVTGLAEYNAAQTRPLPAASIIDSNGNLRGTILPLFDKINLFTDEKGKFYSPDQRVAAISIALSN